MPALRIYRDRGFSLTPLEFKDDSNKEDGRFAWYEYDLPGNSTDSIRGKCNGRFSSASCRRLREFCMKYYVPDKPCLGVTFTIPGVWIVPHFWVKKLWQRFENWCARHSIPLIWRVELQQRGQAHFHFVLYDRVEIALLCFNEWFNLLEWPDPCVIGDEIVNLPVAYHPGSNYACTFEYLDGSHTSFRYLISHTSKEKKSQLGFRGRQWGVVCRDMFKPVSAVDIVLSRDECYSIMRWVKRMTRSRLNQLRGCSSWFCNPETVKRMLYYLRDEKHHGKIETWKLP